MNELCTVAVAADTGASKCQVGHVGVHELVGSIALPRHIEWNRKTRHTHS
jgi:hypothetical protein